MDKELWLAMAGKLEEIMWDTTDHGTYEQLNEIVDKIYEQFLRN